MSNKELIGIDKFVIANEPYENTLQEDLYINSTDLSSAFEDHAQRFSWYATGFELASDYDGRLKIELVRLGATLYNTYKAEAVSTGMKITEKGRDNRVITTDIYLSLQDQYLGAARQTRLLKAARDAMIHRKDMLVSAASNYRAEIQSDISLRTQQLKQ